MIDVVAHCVYYVSTMQAALGQLEVVVLMGVLHLAHDANGSAVRDVIERRTGRPISRGAVYVTLDRLEAKHLLQSRLIDAPNVRGGAKRLFRVTAQGRKALREAMDTIARMHDGLKPALGDL